MSTIHEVKERCNMGVRGLARSLGISPAYCFEMLNGTRPVTPNIQALIDAMAAAFEDQERRPRRKKGLAHA